MTADSAQKRWDKPDRAAEWTFHRGLGLKLEAGEWGGVIGVGRGIGVGVGSGRVVGWVGKLRPSSEPPGDPFGGVRVRQQPILVSSSNRGRKGEGWDAVRPSRRTGRATGPVGSEYITASCPSQCDHIAIEHRNSICAELAMLTQLS